jgi:hypothetical protein
LVVRVGGGGAADGNGVEYAVEAAAGMPFGVTPAFTPDMASGENRAGCECSVFGKGKLGPGVGSNSGKGWWRGSRRAWTWLAQ